MSDFNAIALMIALVGVAVSVYHLIDRWFHNRLEIITTGLVQGAPVPVKHRRLLLNTSWLESVAAQIGFLSIMALAWLLLGRNAGTEEIRMLAYLCSFYVTVAAVGWITFAPVWYFRLSSILRQAEAD
jgi:predicted secreted protein